jgi:hypothetical protein
VFALLKRCGATCVTDVNNAVPCKLVHIITITLKWNASKLNNCANATKLNRAPKGPESHAQEVTTHITNQTDLETPRTLSKTISILYTSSPAVRLSSNAFTEST